MRPTSTDDHSAPAFPKARVIPSNTICSFCGTEFPEDREGVKHIYPRLDAEDPCIEGGMACAACAPEQEAILREAGILK